MVGSLLLLVACTDDSSVEVHVEPVAAPPAVAPAPPPERECAVKNDWEPILVGATRTKRGVGSLAEFHEIPFEGRQISVEFKRSGCEQYLELFRFKPMKADTAANQLKAAEALLGSLKQRTATGEGPFRLSQMVSAAGSTAQETPHGYVWACGDSDCSVTHYAPDELTVTYTGTP